MSKKLFTVAGGDMRLVYLLRQLEKEPFCTASGIYLDQAAQYLPCAPTVTVPEVILPKSDVVIFGLPMVDPDGRIRAPLSSESPEVKSIFSMLRPGTLVFGGNIPQSIYTLASQQELIALDYMQREEFAVRNAVPTAEGAIEIVLRERNATLYGASCLVLGYGRISKVLIKLLVAFGARVTVAARKPQDLEWATLAGTRAVHISKIDSLLSHQEIVFNTVPALLLDESRLRRLPEHCLTIDLASKPGGVDFQAAECLSRKVIWALSLPGKQAPVSAGTIILDTIRNMLQERGYIHE